MFSDKNLTLWNVFLHPCIYFDKPSHECTFYPCLCENVCINSIGSHKMVSACIELEKKIQNDSSNNVGFIYFFFKM